MTPRTTTTTCCLTALMALTLGAVEPLTAQAPEVGFIRFVNTISLPGDLTIQRDGKDLRSRPFALGGRTGSIGLRAGDYNFSFSHPKCEGLEELLNVEPMGSITWIISYKRIEPKEGGAQKPGEPTYRVVLRALEPLASDGKTSINFVSMSRRPLLQLTALYNRKQPGKNLALLPWEQKRLELPAPGDILLGSGNFKLASFTIEQPGHFAIIVFDDPGINGGLRAIYFDNEIAELGG